MNSLSRLNLTILIGLIASIFLACNSSHTKAESIPDLSSNLIDSVTTIVLDRDTIKSLKALSIDHKMVNIDQIKSKYILLDFWASWCPPCRKGHPALTRAYSEIADTTLIQFVSISLDESYSEWATAIAKDRLIWPYHLSDMKGWDSQFATAFGVENIPTNFLLDSSRRIIARDIAPDELVSYIKSLK